ncbi:hypothetical protein JQ567_17470 [Bradyrhizobium sp. AUGA SZCCT0431]|nr:hypothetical protein [Bradyrhizobium sp. AUGA SZCCT0431]
MTSITDVLAVLRPGAQWTVNGDAYSGIQWLDQAQTKPTQAEVTAEIARQDALPPPTLADRMDAVQFKIAFNHENRVRVLEGKAQLTAAQFKTALNAILGS